jgi:hypothetical protein
VKSNSESISKLNILSERYNYAIFGDELNARRVRYGDTTNNSKGQIIYTWFQENNVESELTLISPFTPTYPNSSSILDYFIISQNLRNMLNRNIRYQTLASFSNHHVSLHIVLNFHKLIYYEPPIYRSFKNSNRISFRRDVHDW